MLLRAFLISIITFCFIPYVSADDRGRLPDGRAFRTDQEGNQLVDYIAELELSVQSLNRQVQGLESEVKTKQELLEKAQQKAESSQPILAVKEKDLLQASADKAVGCPQCNGAPSDTSCTTQLKQINASLEEARSDLEIERQLGQKKINELQAQLASLEKESNSRKDQLESLRASLSEEQTKASNALAALADSRKEIEVTRSEMVSTTRESTRQEATAAGIQAVVDADPRASLSLSRVRALDAVRGRIQTELNQLRALIIRRDEMYKRYSQQKHVVVFKPAAAASDRGRSLNDIAKEIQNADSFASVSAYQRDVQQISRKIQDDIGLMQRVGRLK